MERKQTESERAFLENLVSGLPTGRRRAKEAVENFFVILAIGTLLGLLIWGAIAWLIQKVIGAEIGWFSEYAFPVAPAIVIASAIWAMVSTWNWMKAWPDHRERVHDDLEAGLVTEDVHTVVEAKCLQEQEYGSLLYFLKTSDERVLVLYDRESMELSMLNEDPLGSSFEPQSTIRIVKGPNSGFTISMTFSGDAIDIHGPIDMTASPREWPDDEKFYPFRWEEIEERLCA